MVSCAALNYAKQMDALQCDGNPMEYTTVPMGCKDRTTETAAYSLEEITSMWNALVTNLLQARLWRLRLLQVCADLNCGDLRWEDFRDNQLFVTRTVWNTSERDKTKTASQRPGAGAPRLAILLETHRNGFPERRLYFRWPEERTAPESR